MVADKHHQNYISWLSSNIIHTQNSASCRCHLLKIHVKYLGSINNGPNFSKRDTSLSYMHTNVRSRILENLKRAIVNKDLSFKILYCIFMFVMCRKVYLGLLKYNFIKIWMSELKIRTWYKMYNYLLCKQSWHWDAMLLFTNNEL